MCNCGHEQRDEAQKLKQRSVAAVASVLCIGAVLISIGKGHPPLVYAGVGVQICLIVLAVSMLRRSRRLLCGQA